MPHKSPIPLPLANHDGWKPIVGYPNYYFGPDLQIYSCHNGALSKKQLSERPGGYFVVGLVDLHHKEKTPRYHVLLLLTFKGPKPSSDSVARHLDGNPKNNSLDNLEWGTSFDNAQDRKKHGRNWKNKGSENSRSVLNDSCIIAIRKLAIEKVSQRMLARAFGVHPSTIDAILNNRSWKHLPSLEALQAAKEGKQC